MNTHSTQLITYNVLEMATLFGQEAYTRGVKVPSADVVLTGPFWTYLARDKRSNVIRAWLNGWYEAKKGNKIVH